MKQISVKKAAVGAGGELYGKIGAQEITGVCIDSREVKPGDLYVALKGERVDGHSFIKGAVEKGASGILASFEKKDQAIIDAGDVPLIFVEDTLKGMGNLAAWYRNEFQVKVVAVTGSSGKTTTKDMISSVLSKGSSTHKTEGNHNNLVGLPLTIFGLGEEHETMVLEMGMDRLGEIQALSEIGRPDIAVITNIGTAHMENLGSRENIFKAKTEIFEGLRENGTAIVNGDDEYLGKLDRKDFRILKYGFSENCEYRCVKQETHEDGSQVFSMKGPDLELELRLLFPGKHNIMNAMAAVLCGIVLGMDLEAIQKGVLDFRPSKLRMEFFDGWNGSRIINDSYNANPDSMKAALAVLTETGGRKKYAALGDMLELGTEQDAAHVGLLEHIHRNGGVRGVLTFGGLFEKAATAWNGSEAGIKAKADGFNVQCFSDKETLIDQLKNLTEPGDLVLVKGSRGMRMEQVADGLRK